MEFLANLSPMYFFWGIFFSVVGFAYYRYGRKTGRAVSTWTGVLLMIYPCFVSNVWILAITGFVLSIFPFVANRFGYR